MICFFWLLPAVLWQVFFRFSDFPQPVRLFLPLQNISICIKTHVSSLRVGKSPWNTNIMKDGAWLVSEFMIKQSDGAETGSNVEVEDCRDHGVHQPLNSTSRGLASSPSHPVHRPTAQQCVYSVCFPGEKGCNCNVGQPAAEKEHVCFEWWWWWWCEGDVMSTLCSLNGRDEPQLSHCH